MTVLELHFLMYLKLYISPLSLILLTYLFIYLFLFYYFFLKTGFHHVGQADLELPTSGDLPTLASKELGLQV